MLALTSSATEAIQGILTAPGLPDSAGLRIVGEPQIAGGLEPVHRPGLQVMVAEAPAETDRVLEAPAETDRVLEESGARVFVDEAVAPMLDDKLLDADVADGGVSFTIGQQAA